jgi:hypothetical protein
MLHLSCTGRLNCVASSGYQSVNRLDVVGRLCDWLPALPHCVGDSPSSWVSFRLREPVYTRIGRRSVQGMEDENESTRKEVEGEEASTSALLSSALHSSGRGQQRSGGGTQGTGGSADLLRRLTANSLINIDSRPRASGPADGDKPKQKQNKKRKAEGGAAPPGEDKKSKTARPPAEQQSAAPTALQAVPPAASHPSITPGCGASLEVGHGATDGAQPHAAPMKAAPAASSAHERAQSPPSTLPAPAPAPVPIEEESTVAQDPDWGRGLPSGWLDCPPMGDAICEILVPMKVCRLLLPFWSSHSVCLVGARQGGGV